MILIVAQSAFHADLLKKAFGESFGVRATVIRHGDPLPERKFRSGLIFRPDLANPPPVPIEKWMDCVRAVVYGPIIELPPP